MAIIVSMVMLGYQASDPPVYVVGRKRGTNVFRPISPEHPEDETLSRTTIDTSGWAAALCERQNTSPIRS